MRIVNRLLRSIDSINSWTAKLISPLILVIVLIIGWEVFSRAAFNSPTIWVHELSQMIFGTFFMLAGGYILLLNRHVSVDILTRRLPVRVRGIISVLTSVLFFAYCGVLLYKGFDIAWPAFLRGEYTSSVWAPPRWPMMMMIPLGAFLILLQGVAKLIRDLISVVTGRTA